ncbi:hypothetical protein BDV06DRAFT_222350 [Aspergillus oleicola]
MQRRVCDQCYARKKKCLISTSATCLRCVQASLTCTNTRHQPRSGRPPRSSHGLPRTAASLVGVWDIATSPEENSNLDPHDDVENFYLHHDIYMLGSTFAPAFQRALLYCHCHSSNLLDDIITACGTSLSWARFGTLPLNKVDVHRGAVSVRKLRKATITNVHDALAVLMLGQALAAFDTLVDCTSTMSILRYSLEMVRPWYKEILELEDGVLEPVGVVPVFWDMIWCLVYREVPVIEPRLLEVVTRKGVVDRVVGVCTELMPALYELCVVSRELATAGGFDSVDSLSQSQSKMEMENRCQTLSTIERQVQDWDPGSNTDLSRYTTVEVLSMKTQASMYRTATLLFIHRLRLHHSHDRTLAQNLNLTLKQDHETPQILATQILDSREHFFTLAGPHAKLQSTSFPLLLALLENPTSTEGLWESSTWLRHKPACVERLFGFVDEYWRRKRDEGFEGDVLDAVQWPSTDGRERRPVPLI